jgi:hypothetical protein
VTAVNPANKANAVSLVLIPVNSGTVGPIWPTTLMTIQIGTINSIDFKMYQKDLLMDHQNKGQSDHQDPKDHPVHRDHQAHQETLIQMAILQMDMKFGQVSWIWSERTEHRTLVIPDRTLANGLLFFKTAIFGLDQLDLQDKKVLKAIKVLPVHQGHPDQKVNAVNLVSVVSWAPTVVILFSTKLSFLLVAQSLTQTMTHPKLPSVQWVHPDQRVIWVWTV